MRGNQPREWVQQVRPEGRTRRRQANNGTFPLAEKGEWQKALRERHWEKKKSLRLSGARRLEIIEGLSRSKIAYIRGMNRGHTGSSNREP